MSIGRSQVLVVASVAVIALMALSGAQAYDRLTWVLEVFPVAIALAILWVSYPSFPLTNLLYFLIFLHALVLMTGGLYTYARVPVGFQIEDLLGLSRNPYDKLGHFFQGLVPVLVAREILIRGRYVQGRKMLAFIVVCIVLAISASYELFEWATAVALGQGADEFLGTQGDPWDTQSDMLFAFIGAVTALLVFSRIHDRQIRRIEQPDPSIERAATDKPATAAHVKR